MTGQSKDHTPEETPSDEEARDARFLAAASGASVGIWDWNPQTKDFFLSPLAQQLLRHTEATFPGDIKKLLERIHPDDHKMMSDHFRDFRKGSL